MSRARSDTIGNLGRVPARTIGAGSRPTTPTPPRPLPPTPTPDPRRDRDGGVWRWIQGALFENLGLKFLSMVLAVTVFLLVTTDKDKEITVRVGIDYVAHPPDKVPVGEPLDEVRVTFKGASRVLKRIDERELSRIPVDMRKHPRGEVTLDANMLADLPSGVSVTAFSPRTIRIAYDNRIEKPVEVIPALTGRPQHGYVIAETRLTPATVSVRGPESRLATLTAIRTADIAVDRRTENFDAEVGLAPPDWVTVDPRVKVSVAVRIEEDLDTRKLPGLGIGVRGDDAAKWAIAPAQVDVILTGALLALEKAKDQLKPHVKVTPGDNRREAEVLIEGLPPGVGVRLSPERVKITPVR